MNYTLVRHATAVFEIGGRRFLIDPMLDPAHARPAIRNTPNQQQNPLVDLPDGWEQLIASPDALVVTHLHADHFDGTAERTLDHDLPLLCQSEDAERLRQKGFSDVRGIEHEAELDGVTLMRTIAQHGTGAIGLAMAPASGFVFLAQGEPRVYVAGDTIWCEEMSEMIATHLPEVIVLNASGARFLEGDPIVMTAEDVAKVHKAAPDALLIVVHLEAINHCLETRQHYRETLPELGVALGRVRIPEDGETVTWEPRSS
ncbi:MAG TPA: MBL fold metallo-hydrolase [Thermomicrobiales bacterium]|nr:MBL fold metallo-hydrolase [Thermomicrobiales bacterium]